MKLEVKCCTDVHKEMITAVAWTPDNGLYSMSDDSTIHRWDAAGNPSGKVMTCVRLHTIWTRYRCEPFVATFVALVKVIAPIAGDKSAQYRLRSVKARYGSSTKKIFQPRSQLAEYCGCSAMLNN